MGQLELTDGRIDLWHVFTDDAAVRQWADATLAQRASEGVGFDLLSAEERRRAARYTHQEAQRQFVLGRVLLRTALARYTGAHPKSIEFAYNHHGKPALRSPSEMRLEFSLSHTRGLVVCAVALACPVGVDVEDRRRPHTIAPLELARRYFAPAETAVLERLPAERQLAAFLDFWTLKEAFVKACGTGLAMPLVDFAFSLFPGRPPAIAFAGPSQHRPEAWQFAQPHLAPEYHIALAVHRGDSGGERGEGSERGAMIVLRGAAQLWPPVVP